MIRHDIRLPSDGRRVLKARPVLSALNPIGPDYLAAYRCQPENVRDELFVCRCDLLAALPVRDHARHLDRLAARGLGDIVVPTHAEALVFSEASHSLSMALRVTPRSGIPSFSQRHTVDLSTPKKEPISSWVQFLRLRSSLRSMFAMRGNMHNAHRLVKSKRTPKICFTHYYG